MGKNNKIRRALKHKKWQKRLKTKTPPSELKAFSGQLNKQFRIIQNPLKDLTLDEREAVLGELGKNSKKYFSDAVDEIKGLYRDNDPLQLLSMLSFYELTVGAGDFGVSSGEEKDITQFHPEFAQALLLSDKCFENEKMVKQDSYPEFKESLLKLSNSMRYLDYTAEDIYQTTKDHAIKSLSKLIQAKTQIVRNWGYFRQVNEISSELFSPLDNDYLLTFGFKATDTILFFEKLTKLTERRASTHFKKLSAIFLNKTKHELVKSYYKEFLGGENQDYQKFINSSFFKDKSISDIKAMLYFHQDTLLKEIYTFSQNEMAVETELEEHTISSILKFFSLCFGEIDSFNANYIIYDNPIWSRPIIRLGHDIFFCSLPQVFFSFVLKSLTHLADGSFKQKLEKRKSMYLEDKIEKIVSTRFPEKQIFKNIKWDDDGKEYETDIVLNIDSCLLIIEAKAGKISAPALRGAPERLKKHIEEILIAPNLQSKRLKDLIVRTKTEKQLSPKLIKELPIDLSKITKILRMSVSLEDFAMIQSNIKRLEGTEWLPEDFSPCPTMNIADFETLFNLLDHPLQIIHYIDRRQSIEEKNNFIGDELDLLGHYIKTSFDPSYFPTEKELIINLDGCSKDIDNYFNSLSHGIILPKPKVNLSHLWEKIIRTIEERNFPRWTEIGTALLQVAPGDQTKILRKMKEIIINVKQNWKKKGHVNTLVFSPANGFDTSLAFVFFCEKNRENRNSYIDSARDMGFEAKHIQKCLIVAINIDIMDRPYDLIGMFNRSSISAPH